VGLKSTRKAGVAERKPDVIIAKLGMVAKKPGAASINTGISIFTAGCFTRQHQIDVVRDFFRLQRTIRTRW